MSHMNDREELQQSDFETVNVIEIRKDYFDSELMYYVVESRFLASIDQSARQKFDLMREEIIQPMYCQRIESPCCLEVLHLHVVLAQYLDFRRRTKDYQQILQNCLDECQRDYRNQYRQAGVVLQMDQHLYGAKTSLSLAMSSGCLAQRNGWLYNQEATHRVILGMIWFLQSQLVKDLQNKAVWGG